MRALLLAGAVLCAMPLAGAAAAPLTIQDQTFVKQAAIGGMAEVRAGKLATTKAQAPDVKQFAEQMITDHTPNNQQLVALAKQKNVTVPKGLDAKHKLDMAALRRAPASQFDKTYIEGQVAGHQEMATVMQTEIQSGSDPDLKAFALKTLPVVQSHLQMATQLQSKS